jgi:hypothetical protein
MVLTNAAALDRKSGVAQRGDLGVDDLSWKQGSRVKKTALGRRKPTRSEAKVQREYASTAKINFPRRDVKELDPCQSVV